MDPKPGRVRVGNVPAGASIDRRLRAWWDGRRAGREIANLDYRDVKDLGFPPSLDAKVGKPRWRLDLGT